MSFKVATVFLVGVIVSSCKDDEPAPSGGDSSPSETSVVEEFSGDGSGTSGADIVVSGQLTLDTLPTDVRGSDGTITLNQQEVTLVNGAGLTVARGYASSDGQYSIITPGAIAVSDGSLGIADSGVRIRSVITRTANDAVIGVDQGLDLSRARQGVLATGRNDFKKITAIRGRVLIEGARDHVGSVVYIPGTSFAARTDSSGYFVMTFLSAGTYDLRIEKDGYLPSSVSGVSVIEGDTTSIPEATLKLSGGASFFTVKQRGTPGISASRTVTFDIAAGNADRFKGGLIADLEALPYTAVPSDFSYTFTSDGTFDLKMMFADADGFESTVIRTVIVDTIAPSPAGLALADRDTLNTDYTNERSVIAYHSTCADIDAVAILPSSATSAAETDYIWPCNTDSGNRTQNFRVPSDASVFNYKLWVRDFVGNVSSTPLAGTLTYDATPPGALPITFSDQTNGLTTGTDITTVNATVSSCDDVEYVLFSESQSLPPTASQFSIACSTSTNAYTYTFATNVAGTKTVFAWAMDHAGNIGQVATTATMILDYTAPTASSFTLSDPTPASAGYSNSTTVTATLSTCSDTTHVLISESQSSQPTVASSGWVSCTTGGTTVTAGGEGSRTFYLWARDIAGNISASPATSTIIVDTTPPSTPSFTLVDQTAPSQTSMTNSQTVNIAIGSCGDTAKVYLAESSSTPNYASFADTCATSGLTKTFASSTNELKTIYMWAADAAGNVATSASSATITLDTIAPTLPASVTLRDQTSLSTDYSNAVGLDFTLSDCPSGILIYLAEGQSSAPSEGTITSSCNSTGSVTLSGTSSGTRTVYLWAKDSAGNISSTYISDTITFDNTAPTAPALTLADASGGASAGYTNAVGIKATLSTCSDITYVLLSNSASTPSESSISNSCSTSSQNYSHTIATSEGSNRVYVYAKDAAGNISSAYADIVYDVTNPSISNFKITAMTTSTLGVSYSSSENIPTRLDWATSSGGYSAPDDYIGANSATSHTYSISGLTADTAYYATARAIDYAENSGTHPEISARATKLTKIYHATDSDSIGGYNSNSGQKTVILCDINDDGKKDLVVGVPSVTYSSRSGAGAVYVKFGTASPSTSYDIATNADLTIYGASASQGLGQRLGCGQFGGSSAEDLVLVEGSSGDDAYVIYGSSTVTSTNPRDTSNAGHYSLMLNHSAQIRSASVGDLNNDGYADIYLSSYNAAGVGYLGGSSPDATSDFSVAVPGTTSQFGTSTIILNVDGDSYNDLVVGDATVDNYDNSLSSTGAAYIYRGASTYTGSRSINTSVYGYQAYAYRGVVDAPGDYDGDGYADFVMRERAGPSAGKAQIVWGRATASWDALTGSRLVLTSSDIYFNSVGQGIERWYSASMLSAADIDGDGKSDLLVGSGTTTALGKTKAGQACLFLGRSRAAWSALASSYAIALTSADMCFLGATANDSFGDLVTIGDVVGDTRKDLVIAAPYGDGASDVGVNRGEISLIEVSVPTSYVAPISSDVTADWP